MTFKEQFLRSLSGLETTPPPAVGHYNTPSNLDRYFDQEWGRLRLHGPEGPVDDSASVSGEGEPLELEWDPETMGDEFLPLGWEDEDED